MVASITRIDLSRSLRDTCQLYTHRQTITTTKATLSSQWIIRLHACRWEAPATWDLEWSMLMLTKEEADCERNGTFQTRSRTKASQSKCTCLAARSVTICTSRWSHLVYRLCIARSSHPLWSIRYLMRRGPHCIATTRPNLMVSTLATIASSTISLSSLSNLLRAARLSKSTCRITESWKNNSHTLYRSIPYRQSPYRQLSTRRFSFLSQYRRTPSSS